MLLTILKLFKCQQGVDEIKVEHLNRITFYENGNIFSTCPTTVFFIKTESWISRMPRFSTSKPFILSNTVFQRLHFIIYFTM